MNISIDFDQEQRAASYEAIEEIYLEGISDGFAGRLPAMAEIIYLQGYCEGMRQGRAEIGINITVTPEQLSTELVDLPLLCGQCAHLINGKCRIKDIARNSDMYACDRVLVDSPF
ncbi:hypothetical protein [Chroococcidiopsis sp.]|uniref:hypothetical protein n=1 Tax=Chroococcidiopsis sp. TaxID=3088168 RepID=UPI003F34F00A